MHAGQTNIAMEHGHEMKMYFLLKMGMFQPAIVSYTKGPRESLTLKILGVFPGNVAGKKAMGAENRGSSEVLV